MNGEHRILWWLGGIVAFGSMGCAPYQPYGYPPMGSPTYSQPAPTYGAPGGTYSTPGPLYAPGSNNSPPLLVPTTPGGTSPYNGGQNPSGGPPPNNNGGNNAPTWQPDKNPSRNTYDNTEKPVPLPGDDPGFGNPPGAARPPQNGTSSLTPMNGGPQLSMVPTQSARVANAAGDADVTFEEPTRVQSASASKWEPEVAVARQPNPYGHDRESYAWLRGKLDYDRSSQTWHITYNLTPDSSDELGGDVALVPNEQMKALAQIGQLKPDAVVVVEGQIDLKVRDTRGKPAYAVRELTLLQ